MAATDDMGVGSSKRSGASLWVIRIVSVILTIAVLIGARSRYNRLNTLARQAKLREKQLAQKRKRRRRRARPGRKKTTKAEAEKGNKNINAIKHVIKKPPEDWMFPLMGAVATVTLLLGLIIGAVLKLLVRTKVVYHPVSASGRMDAPNMERAVEAVCTQCRRLGFEPQVKIGLQEADPDPDAKGALSFVEHTTIRSYADGRLGAVGPESKDRAIEVKIDKEADGFQLTARAFFPEMAGKDCGETEYCRETVSKILGREVRSSTIPTVSFLALLTLSYGVLASLPVLFSPVGLDKYQCLGWIFVITCWAAAALFGLLALLRILLTGGRLYGIPAALGGIAMSIAGILVVLSAEMLPITS